MHDTLKLWTQPDTRYVRACHPTAVGALILTGIGTATGTGLAIGAGTTVSIFGTSVALAPIVGTAVLLGVAITGELLLTQRATNKSQDGQQNIKQAIPPRRRAYGQVKIGGVFNFQEEKNGVLYEGLLINEGEIGGILEQWLNDDMVTLTGSAVTDPTTYVINDIERVHLFTKPGTETQTAYATLVSAFPAIWSNDHRSLGVHSALCTFDSVKADKYQKIYPQGVPNYREIIQASKVVDPRDPAQQWGDKLTWQYSDNAAVCLLDYLVSPKGMGLPLDFVTPAIEEWRYAANVADQVVATKDGGSERRYRLAGSYEIPTPPKDMLAALTSASDSWLYLRSDGAVGIRPGIWEEPTVTISDEHILASTMRQGRGPLREANVIKAQYVSRDHDYQTTEAQEWRDEASVSEMGEELEQAVDLTWSPSHAQTRRLMKLQSFRTNPNWIGSVRTNLYGLNALGERRIRLRYSELGIDETFEVSAFDIDLQTPACIISLQSMPAEAYDWDPLTEEGDAPPIPEKNTDAGTIENVTGFAATVDTLPASATKYITFTWDAPTADNVHAVVQFQLDGGTTWQTLTVAGDNLFTQTPGIPAGTYDARMRWETNQKEGAYATIDNIVVS